MHYVIWGEHISTFHSTYDRNDIAVSVGMDAQDRACSIKGKQDKSLNK